MAQAQCHQAEGTQKGERRTSERGMKSGGTQPVDLSNVWDRCADASRLWDTAPRIGNPLVVGHSPGLLPDKKRSCTRSRDGPNPGVTEAPGQDYLSLTPSRPGRGYGAGPAAVKGGSTGFRHSDNNKKSRQLLR